MIQRTYAITSTLNHSMKKSILAGINIKKCCYLETNKVSAHNKKNPTRCVLSSILTFSFSFDIWVIKTDITGGI